MKNNHLLFLLITLTCFLTFISTRTITIISDEESNDIKSNHIEKQFSSVCKCVGFTCGCCAHLTIEKIGLNSSVCVNLTYLPNDVGISFTVTIGNRTVYNETISARSPPPICFGVPFLKEMAEICIKFYDLDASLHKLHGCVKLEARIGHVLVADYDFGCFDIGNSTRMWTGGRFIDRIEVIQV